MKMTPKRWGNLLLLILLIGAGVWLVKVTKNSYQEGRNGTHRVMTQAVMDTQELLRVTSLEGVRSVPITSEKEGVGVFALGYYRVRVSYDVEALQYFIHGDTLRLQLPPAEITILEHEELGFQVLDIWGTNFWKRLTGARLSLEEENQLRERAMNELRAELYRDGTVKRANEQAKCLILQMLSLVPGTIILEESHAIPLDMPHSSVVSRQ